MEIFYIIQEIYKTIFPETHLSVQTVLDHKELAVYFARISIKRLYVKFSTNERKNNGIQCPSPNESLLEVFHVKCRDRYAIIFQIHTQTYCVCIFNYVFLYKTAFCLTD